MFSLWKKKELLAAVPERLHRDLGELSKEMEAEQ